ncbi:VQ motif-containing protein 22-like [Salvia splendens]|uniref:VQ motif-containing protein 22-like n=1 Tax=Salvia splendens TaxID=180675 RepID=UPI001C27D717|nr:VQ motif-containing protein 22-like [Salvia splendens]XP_042044206.1 VQ motif-containing protein 22-like [Salvia splendens]
MSYPHDWMQLNFTNENQTNTPPITAAASNNTPAADEGRGARPIRRRSRASRRTPTTLLNTDTTNFRAMVQQFTGIPAATSTAAPPGHLVNAAGMFDFTQRSNLYQGRGAQSHVQYPIHMQQRHVLTVADVHGRGGGGGGGAPPESSSPNESRDYESYML